MNIVFFGSSSYVIPIIKILKKDFDLKLVLTTEKSNSAVPSFCQQNKIEFISIKQPARNASQRDAGGFNNLTIEQLKETKAQVAVLADFGLIIPEEILNTFPKGIINIHPSLLPKYRGPTPVQTAILNGEKITGVSIMKVDEKIDHGPILGQEKEKILDMDTAETLYKRLFAKGANLLPKVLNSYLKGKLKPIAQNHAKATFTKTLTRQDGYVEMENGKWKMENGKLERKIRAYFPWPGVWTKWQMKNGKCKILKFLPEQKLQVEGKKPMSYKDFLNGYSEAKELLEPLE